MELRIEQNQLFMNYAGDKTTDRQNSGINFDMAIALKRFKKTDVTVDSVKTPKNAVKPQKTNSDKAVKKLKKPWTEKNEAKKELENKKAANGLTYKKAKNIINKIIAKYRDVEGAWTTDDELRNGMFWHHPRFNPDVLHGKDKTDFLDAVAAKKEIEQNNQALIEKANRDPITGEQEISINDFEDYVSWVRL